MSNNKGDGIKVSREDKLEAELLHQRILNVLLEEQLATLKLQEVQNRRITAIEAANRFKALLSDRYQIDFTTHEIQEDGSIVPRSNNLAALQQQLTALAQKG